MAYSGGVVKRPVSTIDISQAIGVASRSVGVLCSHTNINRWAKYKPVRLTSTGETGEDTGNNYWQAYNGQCGMGIQQFADLGTPTTSSAFLYKLLNNNLRWTKELPTGGINAYPYRMLDFDGYMHSAQNPIGSIASTALVVDSQGRLTIAYDYGSLGSRNLNYTDIAVGGARLSTFYPAVLLYRSSSDWYVRSSSTPLSGGDFQIVISGMGSVSGAYTCCPFLSSKILSGGAAERGVYISCDLPPVNVVISQSTSPIVSAVNGYWNSSNNIVSFEAMVTNQGAASKTISDMVVIINSTTGSQSPDAGTREGQMSISSFTVAGYSMVTKTGSIAITRNMSKIYWIKASASGVTSEWLQIEEDAPIEL